MQYRIYLNKIVIYLFFFLLFTNNGYSIQNKIILKIENEIITNIDVENEKNYLEALNPKIKNIDKKSFDLIAKNSLIREKIKKNEILKYIKKIELNEKFLNQIIENRYSRLNLNNKDQFLNYLKQYNIDLDTVEKKISIEALWNQLIYQKFYKNIKIDKKKLELQIKEKFEQNEKNLLLSEIVFNISKKDDLNKKYLKILKTIEKENFESAALTHSISDSSVVGGKLGWVKQSSLNKEINEKLSNLKKGEVSKPIFTPNGYLILKIDDINFIEKKYNKEIELNELIKLKTNEQLNQQSIIYFNKIKKNTNINAL